MNEHTAALVVLLCVCLAVLIALVAVAAGRLLRRRSREYPLADPPPYHPNCRCAIYPVEEDERTMTCDRYKDKTGYRGQSHEVWATFPGGGRKRLGWQNGEDVSNWASLAKAWRLTDVRAEPVRPNGGLS